MLGRCWKINQNSTQNLCESVKKEQKFLLVEITRHFFNLETPIEVEEYDKK